MIQLLADPAHLPEWLRGLVLHESLSGMHGQVGTRSRVVMQTGQQKVEGTETITRREQSRRHMQAFTVFGEQGKGRPRISRPWTGRPRREPEMFR